VSLDLEHPCFYRINGLHCHHGELADCMNIVQCLGPNEPMKCPACQGTETLTTTDGEVLLAFIKKHLRPMVAELVREVMDAT